MTGLSRYNNEQSAKSTAQQRAASFKLCLIVILLCIFSTWLLVTQWKPSESRFTEPLDFTSSSQQRKQQLENHRWRNSFDHSSSHSSNNHGASSSRSSLNNFKGSTQTDPIVISHSNEEKEAPAYSSPPTFYRRKNVHIVDTDQIKELLDEHFPPDSSNSDDLNLEPRKLQRRSLSRQTSFPQQEQAEEKTSDNHNSTEVAFASIPLYGDAHETGYYYTNLYVGTPAQKQSVIVDTGSSLFGFPCSDCKQCGHGHINPFFNISESTTFEWIYCNSPFCYTAQCNLINQSESRELCTYSLEYTEGSAVSGHFFSDVVSLSPTLYTVHKSIGCHTRETFLFLSQKANGIVGLAPRGSDFSQNLIVDTLLSLFPKEKRIFSLCLSDEGGLLQFGVKQGINSEDVTTKGNKNSSAISSEEEIIWTNVVSQFRNDVIFRGVTFQENRNAMKRDGGNFLIHGKSLGVCIVDSGTTFTYFPRKVFNTIIELLLTVCSRNKCKDYREPQNQSLCWKPEDIDMGMFPVFEFHLKDNKKIFWKPEAYLLKQTLAKNKVFICAAIDVASNNYQTVLGMSFMKHHKVFFNRNEHTIGFIPSSCEMTTSDSDLEKENKEKSTKFGAPLKQGEELGEPTTVLTPGLNETVQLIESNSSLVQNNNAIEITSNNKIPGNSLPANRTIYPKFLFGFTFIGLLFLLIKFLPKYSRLQSRPVYGPIYSHSASQESIEEQSTNV